MRKPRAQHCGVVPGKADKISLMVDRTRIQEFLAHWQHTPNSNQEFIRFRTRMIEVSRQIWSDYFVKSDHAKQTFAIISGTGLVPQPGFDYSGLLKSLNAAKTVFDVAETMQFLLWTMEAELDHGLDGLCRRLQAALEVSPGIMIRVARHGKTATLYPMGAKLLDEAVVEGNLAWLGKYPEVLKPFEEALKFYMAKDPNQYRNMLDNLRFAVEQMLRAVLNNQKSLENQKTEFLSWLKKHDAHVHIGNMYHELLFDHFAKYQNDAVKHQEDKYTSAEVEFMLYATGTFLRFMQRLIEQESATKASTAPSG